MSQVTTRSMSRRLRESQAADTTLSLEENKTKYKLRELSVKLERLPIPVYDSNSMKGAEASDEEEAWVLEESEEEDGDDGSVEVVHVETSASAELKEASGSEELSMVMSSGSAEKSSVKYDDLQQDSPVKRRLRNLDMRRKVIEKFEVEVTDFVRDFLRAKYAEKFPSSESLYEYSIQIVKDKILQPEITSYSKVIEQGGSWMEFRMNRAIEENVKMYLVQKM